MLKPGGIASLSTEFRVEGAVPALPNILLFDEQELRFVLDDQNWELVEPLDLTLSEATLGTVVDWDTAIADAQAGRDWSYPHIVLHHTIGVTWTSVHVALRRCD